jgi:hypothetical protein
VKRLAIGLCSLLAGVLLCAVNWLGAAAALPAVGEWSGTRMSGAWKLVGHGPLVFGILLIVLGLILLISALYERGDAGGGADK